MAHPDLLRGMCLAALLVLLLAGRRKVVFGDLVHPRAMGGGAGIAILLGASSLF